MVKNYYSDKCDFISLLVFSFINFVFVYKYSFRVTSYPFAIACTYFCFVVLLPFLFFKQNVVRHFKAIYVLLAGYCLVIACSYFFNKPIDSNVDRWSVITSFWDAFFQGQFPYLAKSHMGNPPGPFPFYFVLALPFYLLNEIGFYSMTGLGLMLFFIYNQKWTETKKSFVICMALASPAFFWEFYSRSTIVVNVMLLLMYITWVPGLDRDKKWNVFFIGTLGGFLLSTRGLAIIPLTFCYAFVFLKKPNPTQLFILGCSFVGTFVLTLLPFVLWDFELFLQYNPMTLQSDYLPKWFLVLVILASVALGIVINTPRTLLFAISVTLFVAISFSSVGRVIQYGFQDAFHGSIMDISYLIFVLPFLVMIFGEEETLKPTL
jgi:hypothetical protein